MSKGHTGLGNFIGVERTSGYSGGIFGLKEQLALQSENNWPLQVTRDGLVMFLDAGASGSYSGSGSAWTNLVNPAASANFPNGISYSTSNQGFLTFNGSNQYADIPSSLTNLFNGFTVCALMNWGSASGSWERLIDFGNGPGSNNILIGREGTSNNFRGEIYSGSNFGFGHSWSGGISNGNWQFWSWSKGATTSTVGLNGSYQTTSSTVLPANITRSNNYIGRSNWPDAFFESGMAVFMLYSRELSQAEVTQNFNAVRGRFGL